MYIQSFNVIHYHDFAQKKLTELSEEIDKGKRDYILGVDEQQYIDFLTNKYTFEELIIDYNNVIVNKPVIGKDWVIDRFSDERYQQEFYEFALDYPFIGSEEIFRIHPSTYRMTSTPIAVSKSIASFTFKMSKLDKEEFEKQKNEYQDKAFSNAENANVDIRYWNNDIRAHVSNKFKATKDKYLKETSFYEAINLKVDETSTFAAPTIQKKIIPQPEIIKGKEFSSEPIMAKTIYEDIIKTIYEAGKNMERKPSLYINKDEEALRDQFLFILESRYDGTTATGESFNRSGKVDILLKHASDGTNLFVAECKLWHGASEFQNGISQLFDRYLTWRDSKASLLLFVKNKDFTNVLSNIQIEATKHPYFVKEVGKKGDSSFSYTFRLPQDPNKMVYFEIMAFHFDKS